MEKRVEETRRVPAKKAAKKIAVGEKTAAQKAPTKKSATAAAKKIPAKKAPVTKASPRKAPTKKAPTKNMPAKKAPAKKAPAKKAPVVRKTPAKPVDADLADRWTQTELAEIRADLVEEFEQLESEYAAGVTELDDLQQRANDGAGDDQADAGTKTFEREQELSLLQNKQELIAQSQRALERIDSGTYGRCESCGEPIAKARLQAFPSATLCVTCKQKQERR